MASLNSGQICNTHTSARGLGPQVGKYQSSYSAESRVFQGHLATTSATLGKLKSVWEENPATLCCGQQAALVILDSLGPEKFASDIAVDNHQNTSAVSVRIKASKTDPFRQGVTIYLGVTKTTICPVKAILAYIAVRGTHEGPFFYFSSRKMLTRERFVKEIRLALSKVGMDPDVYAGHSFRIVGAAIVAYAKGIKDS